MPITLILERFQTFVTIFLGIFIAAVPFLLIGSLVSGFIEVFLKRETLLRVSPRRPALAALMGASMGMIFPVCERGVVPVILGLLVPARPLGATAVGNREVSLGGLSSAMAPKESTLTSANREKNLLDWLIAFDGQPDPTAFDGQTANLVGFVNRDSRFADNTFMLSRFIVSCCVADATAIGLIVQSPQAASLATDTNVESGSTVDISGEDALSDSEPAWSPNGREIALSRRMPDSPMDGRAWMMPASGGEGRFLPGGNAQYQSELSWSPDGRTLLSQRTGLTGVAAPQIWLQDVHTGAERVLVDAGSWPRWLP